MKKPIKKPKTKLAVAHVNAEILAAAKRLKINISTTIRNAIDSEIRKKTGNKCVICGQKIDEF